MPTDETIRYLATANIADKLHEIHIEKELPGEMPIIRQLRLTEHDGAAQARLTQDVLLLRNMSRMPVAQVTWSEAERILELPEKDRPQAILEYSQKLSA